VSHFCWIWDWPGAGIGADKESLQDFQLGPSTFSISDRAQGKDLGGQQTKSPKDLCATENPPI
jgi:hypothetical protein